MISGVLRSATVARTASRMATRAALPAAQVARARVPAAVFVRNYSAHAEEETYEEFTQRYLKFFAEAEDLFEVQRGFNNCFSYDLVPAPEVAEAIVRAARRMNDYPTAVRVFEALKMKVENSEQYQQYLDVLEPLRKELGVTLKEELYPGLKK